MLKQRTSLIFLGSIALMKTIATDGSLVAGAHLPFPGIGHIRSEGQGSYAWVPIMFQPLPDSVQ